jgi:hypothetical protein
VWRQQTQTLVNPPGFAPPAHGGCQLCLQLLLGADPCCVMGPLVLSLGGTHTHEGSCASCKRIIQPDFNHTHNISSVTAAPDATPGAYWEAAEPLLLSPHGCLLSSATDLSLSCCWPLCSTLACWVDMLACCEQVLPAVCSRSDLSCTELSHSLSWLTHCSTTFNAGAGL